MSKLVQLSPYLTEPETQSSFRLAANATAKPCEQVQGPGFLHQRLVPAGRTAPSRTKWSLGRGAFS